MASPDTAQRRNLLTAALVTALLPKEVPEGGMMRAWLDSWAGIGHVTVSMARQGFDLQLTRYGNEAWRATFFVEGRAHSRDAASAWEPTTPAADPTVRGGGEVPWRAVQRAALAALARTWRWGEEPRGTAGRPER